MSVYIKELSKSSPHGKSRRSRFWLHILLLLLIGAYLRVWSVSSESPSFDEVMSSLVSRVPAAEYYIKQPQPDYSPPVFYLISHPLASQADTFDALRILSIIAGALTPVALYLMARRLYGETAAILSAYLLALNPLHIYFSQEFHPSATFALLAIGAYLAMVRSAESNRWKDWLVYDILAIILLHTQREAPFFVLAFPIIQLCRAIFFPPANQERRLRRFRLIQGILLNHFIIIAISIPWLFIMPNKPQWEMAAPTFYDLLAIPGKFFLFGITAWKPLAPWLVTLLLFIALLPPVLKTVRHLDFRTFAAIALAILALALPFAYSLLESPRFVAEREGFTAVPWFCLSIGILLARCNWVIKLSLSLLFSGIFLASSINQARTLQKTDTTDMLNVIIRDGAKPDDVLAFWPNYTTTLGTFWKDYYNRPFKAVSLGDLLGSWAEIPPDKPIYFVISQFPSNSPVLYTIQGALHQYAEESKTLWQNNMNMVIRAKNLDQQVLAHWFNEPRSLKILDQPTSNTQFIFTAADAVFKPPVEKSKKDPSKVVQKFTDDEWPFAYNRPDLSYDPTGQRFVWTTKPTAVLELPVRLAPGAYQLKLHCAPDFEQMEYGRHAERKVQLELRAGEDRRKVTLDSPQVVTLSFSTDVELNQLRTSISVDKMHTVAPPSPGAYGIKIYSISIDLVAPGGTPPPN